MTLALCILF